MPIVFDLSESQLVLLNVQQRLLIFFLLRLLLFKDTLQFFDAVIVSWIFVLDAAFGTHAEESFAVLAPVLRLKFFRTLVVNFAIFAAFGRALKSLKGFAIVPIVLHFVNLHELNFAAFAFYFDMIVNSADMIRKRIKISFSVTIAAFILIHCRVFDAAFAADWLAFLANDRILRQLLT